MQTRLMLRQCMMMIWMPCLCSDLKTCNGWLKLNIRVHLQQSFFVKGKGCQIGYCVSLILRHSLWTWLLLMYIRVCLRTLKYGENSPLINYAAYIAPVCQIFEEIYLYMSFKAACHNMNLRWLAQIFWILK